MRPALLCLLAFSCAFAQYSTRRDGDVVRLEDTGHRTTVWIMPSRGNSAFRMTVYGKDVLRFPYASLEEYLKGPSRGMAGIPFLGPWANRLDETAFYANGKKYPFNLELGNVRPGRDNHPIHGFLTNATQWQVVEAKSDGGAAWVKSRLEFYRQPQWMAQFPFAHTIEMTYRLRDGALEVATRIDNLSDDPMPVAIGFHPYFQVNDAPRDQWTFGIAARSEWLLSPDKIPTGEKRPIEQFLPKPNGGSLAGLNLDHVFGDLVRDSAGNATMWVQGRSERLDVAFGPNYKAVVVYAPGSQAPFICFEPMAGITDAMNLAHRGKYGELQSIPPGQSWQESFWVKPSGFTAAER
jgi:aldose 1-epimerase